MAAVERREAARRRSLRIGLVTLIGAILVTTFAVTSQNGLPGYVPGVDRAEVRAVFADTGALRAGDEVRIANVRSGFVESITLVDGQPVVDMRLEGGRQVYADASAGIGARSALGQKFVELDPGEPEAGELSGPIPVGRTVPSVELDQVLDTLDKKTRESAASMIRQTGGGLAGRGNDLSDGLRALPEILEDLGSVSEALTADDGADTAALLRTANGLASHLTGQEQQLADLVEQSGRTFEALDPDDGKVLGELLEAAPPTLVEVRAALQSLDEPLARTSSAARSLRPGAVALGRATPSVRGLLREAVTPLSKVPDVSGQTEIVVDQLTPLLEDARPVVQQLGDTLRRAQRPLTTIAPYSDEVLLFFTNAYSALSQGDAAGRWLRFFPVVNPEILYSSVPVRGPLVQRDPYPAPGAAKDHRTTQLGDRLIDELGDVG